MPASSIWLFPRERVHATRANHRRQRSLIAADRCGAETKNYSPGRESPLLTSSPRRGKAMRRGSGIKSLTFREVKLAELPTTGLPQSLVTTLGRLLSTSVFPGSVHGCRQLVVANTVVLRTRRGRTVEPEYCSNRDEECGCPRVQRH